MVKPLLTVALLFTPIICIAQNVPSSQDCDAIAQLFTGPSTKAVGTLQGTCKATGAMVVPQGNRINVIERDLNLGAFESAADGRLKQLHANSLNTVKRLEGLEAEGIKYENRVKDLEKNAGLTHADIRRIWVLLAAVLVFFMQAGFKCLEVGFARVEHSAKTALMNLSNWLILCLVYWLFGFGLMFGADWHQLGSTLFHPDASSFTAFGGTLHFEFFLFQLAFAATTATIVDGALAERVTLPAYFAIATVTGLLIYPVFGHWAWGGAIDGTTPGWLAARGFKDFAGSTVVHSVGAWVAWIGILFLGPRRFRFVGRQNSLKPFNLGYSVLGVFMLWFGWWGFNGGSLSKFDDTDFFGKVASVILHTNLAGAAAGLTGYAFAMAFGRKFVFEKMIGSTLGGLVAITASCDTVHPLGAIAIGLLAGIVHNVGFDLLIRWKHDDVAGAIPVHGFCGVLGTLCAAFIPGKPFLAQLWTQIIGIGVAVLWAGAVSAVIFFILQRYVGLRASVEEEDKGDAVASQVQVA